MDRSVAARSGEEDVDDAVARLRDLHGRVTEQHHRARVDAGGSLLGGGVEPVLDLGATELQRAGDDVRIEGAGTGPGAQPGREDRHRRAGARGERVRGGQRRRGLRRPVVRGAHMPDRLRLAGAERGDGDRAGAAVEQAQRRRPRRRPAVEAAVGAQHDHVRALGLRELDQPACRGGRGMLGDALSRLRRRRARGPAAPEAALADRGQHELAVRLDEAAREDERVGGRVGPVGADQDAPEAQRHGHGRVTRSTRSIGATTPCGVRSEIGLTRRCDVPGRASASARPARWRRARSPARAR